MAQESKNPRSTLLEAIVCAKYLAFWINLGFSLPSATDQLKKSN